MTMLDHLLLPRRRQMNETIENGASAQGAPLKNTPLENTPNMTPTERLVWNKMVPDQEIRTTALVTVVGPKGPSVAPALSSLADKGYVRVTRKEGNAYLWARNPVRTLGRKGLRRGRKSAPHKRKPGIDLDKMRSDLEAIRVILIRLGARIDGLGAELERCTRIRDAIKGMER